MNHPNRLKHAMTEQQAKHTPGPWGIETEHALITIGASGAGKIACVFQTVLAGDPKANARLIAAAPELLAALKETLETLGDIADKLAHGSPMRNDLEAQYAAIRAAIAKAEGR